MNIYSYLFLICLFVAIGCGQKQSHNEDNKVAINNNIEWQKDGEIATVKEQLTKEPDNVKFVSQLAILYREKSQYYEDMYISTLKSGQKIDPRNLNFPLLLVNYYFNKQHCKLMMDEAMKVIAMDDRYPTIHDLMAQCYVRQSMIPEAIQEFEKAVNILQSDKSLENPDRESKDAAIRSFKNDIENLRRR